MWHGVSLSEEYRLGEGGGLVGEERV